MPATADSLQAFEVRRDRLDETRLVSEPLREAAPGEALIRVDAFALTANNITYGVAGDSIGYWQFFPASSDGDSWGRIPVWGFGDVIESRADGISEGQRFYGYFPMASQTLPSIYEFGEGVLEGGDLTIERDRIGVPGFGMPVTTRFDNPYPDMTD